MEHTLEDLEDNESLGKRYGFFAKAIVVSLLLHAVAALILLSGGKEGGTGGAVTYLDLKMTSFAQPEAASTPVTEASPPEEEAVPVQPSLPPPPPTAAEKLQADLKQAIDTTNPGDGKEKIASYSLGFGMTRGFFRSLAQGESLRGDIREYYLDMLQNINAKWWVDQRIEGNRINAVLINVAIARNGKIIGREIMRSSGNMAYDKMVLDALGAAGPLPPLPDTYEGDVFVAPLRLVPPLSLMAS